MNITNALNAIKRLKIKNTSKTHVISTIRELNDLNFIKSIRVSVPNNDVVITPFDWHTKEETYILTGALLLTRPCLMNWEMGESKERITSIFTRKINSAIFLPKTKIKNAEIRLMWN